MLFCSKSKRRRLMALMLVETHSIIEFNKNRAYLIMQYNYLSKMKKGRYLPVVNQLKKSALVSK